MKHTYCVAVQKGGQGKTTLSIILADILASRGYRVLAIDMEPQKNLSYCYNLEEPEVTIYDVLEGVSIAKAVHHSPNGVDVIAGDSRLYNFQIDNLDSLSRALKSVSPAYDYVVIDTPPVVNKNIMVALNASDRVIIPTDADALGMKAVVQFYSGTFEMMKKQNKKLKIAGVVFNKYKKTNLATHSKGMLTAACQGVGIPVFKTVIRSGCDVPKSQFLQKPLPDVAPKSKVLADFNSFVDELLEFD